MLGKVWSSGALAVVQNVAIIPTSVHPRSKLDGELLTTCPSSATQQSAECHVHLQISTHMIHAAACNACQLTARRLMCVICRCTDNMTERVAELAYIPVYDLRQPEAGVVACLEVMMSSFATSALVANVISHACDLLTQFQVCAARSVQPLAAAIEWSCAGLQFSW